MTSLESGSKVPFRAPTTSTRIRNNFSSSRDHEFKRASGDAVLATATSAASHRRPWLWATKLGVKGVECHAATQAFISQHRNIQRNNSE